MSTADTLRAARALVARPGGWTQYALARDADGEQTSIISLDAVCWDATGAILASFGCVAGTSDAAIALKNAITTDSIGQWNDEPSRTQAEVVAAFDKAIALAEAEAAAS